ncbi:putative ferric-chelate reductase 1 isoform X2 [Apostichopus japonicus]|uniref:putative ferric-chelate reductase 1 isoform X2 n=1 Tax=Stichopus japonicus TaxID=307972 RepID=UPI003AB90618
MKKTWSSLLFVSFILSLMILPLNVSGHAGHHPDNGGDSNDTGCGVDWGCFSHDTCELEEDLKNCIFLFKWRQEDGAIHFILRAMTSGYIALGISESGGMADSEVYSCSVEGVLRGWNSARGAYKQIDVVPNSLSDQKVTSDDGVIICEFKRADYISDSDEMFLDLRSGNNYTVLAAWYPETDHGVPVYHKTNRTSTPGKVDFTQHTTNSAEGGGEFLPKLHGILMTIAWFGFAAVGVTSSRYYKPIWPETTLWGKPVWFSIHRTCMVSALSSSLIAAVVIVIHVQGYILPSEGNIRFLHAIFGTTVIVLAICNAVMAVFRPHPGTPNRPIYNWAHWSVGTLGLYLAMATILLGVIDFNKEDSLLGGIPKPVFWVAAFFVMFHLIIWMSLQYISITIESTGRDNDVPLVNELDESEKAPINGSVGTSASSRMKQLLFWVYITGVIITVLVVVIGIIVAAEE